MLEETGADHPCEFTYVKDMARGLFRAHTVRPLRHRLFNIASCAHWTRGELVRLVKERYPDAVIEVGLGTSETGNLRGPCVLDRAREELGFAPEYALAVGLADWLRELEDAQ